MEYLAKHITVFMSIGAISFISAVAVPLNWVRHRLNTESEATSVRLVGEQIEVLQGQVRTIAQDYNNWGDVYFAAIHGDIDFIADNYGITAINGVIFDGSVMFDGPFEKPIAWTKGSQRLPTGSYLSDDVLDRIREGVSSLPIEGRPTYDFLMATDGELTLLSAARLLPDTPEALADIQAESIPLSVISRSVRSSEIYSIAARLNLSDIHFSTSAGESTTHLAFQGIDGEVIGFLEWQPPRDGNRLFRSILPILGFIFVVFAGVAVAGIRLIDRTALLLVQREAHAARLARIDTLTGLPNRLALTEQIRAAEATENMKISVVLIDLNGFKNVNDLVGHHAGDDMICQFAARISSCVGHRCFVSRIGGDEFVLLVTDTSDTMATANDITSRIIDALAAPFSYIGCSFDISAAFGVASRSDDSEQADELLRRADRAMYHSKRSACNQVTHYDPSMDQERIIEREIELELRTAVHNASEFSVLYQPIVDAVDHTLVRVEALARWHSARLGSVKPDVFVPLAERCGLINVLGDLLLTEIFSNVASEPGLRVGINISPIQLLSAGFVDKVVNMSLQNRVPPECVEFELTEGVAVQNLAAVRQQLETLQSYGFSTALDDFGTGYSSIGYLRGMPFSTLKIDRSFVSGLSSRGEVSTIIAPIISLGHSLSKTVTAEGIETAEEAEYLAQAGCDHLQGYFFGRPEPLQDVLIRFWPGRRLKMSGRVGDVPAVTLSTPRRRARLMVTAAASVSVT